MERNIDLFNAIAGSVFAQLYEGFPNHIQIDRGRIAEAIGAEIVDDTPSNFPAGAPRIINFVEPDSELPYGRMLEASLDWLVDEGFIHKSKGFSHYRLTAKALTALNASPSALGPTLGTRLATTLSQAGGEAKRAAISETVGQVIGAAVRSFAGGT